MGPRTKIICYLVAVAGLLLFGRLFYKDFSRLQTAAGQLGAPAPETNAASVASVPGSETNQAVTNVAAAKPKPAPPRPATVGKDYSRLFIYGGSFVVCVLGFGFLLAHDISSFAGDRAMKLMFNDEGEAMSDPAYEEAEQVWANGEPLEAIRLMRDYLKKNPREQHVALRIAEIYEKDLGNYLAAALEYEDVLTKKLSQERWGWAAIHLCNLYSSKLNQPEKALELLRRVDAECGITAPAAKARKRLAAYDAAGAAALNEEPTA